MNATQILPRNVTTDRMQSHREWMTGFNAYMDGVDFDEEQSVNWRKGWKQAYAGEGECHRQDAAAYAAKEHKVHVLTDAECAAMSAEYADDIADREWWSRGAW